jgi:hypothetical protein
MEFNEFAGMFTPPAPAKTEEQAETA